MDLALREQFFVVIPYVQRRLRIYRVSRPQQAYEKVKITHIIVGLNVGGAELMLKRLIASHAQSQNYTHRVISLTELGRIGESLKAMGVEVRALGMQNGLDVFSCFLRLRRYLVEDQPDIVQTWMYHADLLGGLAARSVGSRQIIWGIRTTDIRSGGSRVTRVIRKVCAFLSRHVPSKIICAAHAARKAHEACGYSAKKMLVIPNGFEVERLFAYPEQVESVRREAGLTPDFRVIGSVGRFNAVKDQRNFVVAAGILARKHPNLRFLMVGRDLGRDNTQLVQWIEETGRAECFVLLGERSDVPACLAAMDIFCLHSRTEGFPNVVGEAMAMARPCVVTDVGDAAFLVADTGVVAPRENPQALAAGLETLLSLPTSELKCLGQKARQRILTHFTMENARRQFEEVYQELSRGSVVVKRTSQS